MKNFREKAQTFLFGMIIGVLIAGSFFILKLDTYFKELNFYKSLVHTFSAESKSQQAKEQDETKHEGEKLKLTHNSKQTILPKKDSLNVIRSAQELEAKLDSLFPDKIDTTEFSISVADEIIVRKDELINSKIIEVNNLNPLAFRNNAKDSMIMKMSGLQEDKTASTEFFNVEYWQSPLNYKGYKMSKNKIVVYGILNSEIQKIIKVDDLLYFKNSTGVYKLEYSSDFKPYEKINDEALLIKFK